MGDGKDMIPAEALLGEGVSATVVAVGEYPSWFLAGPLPTGETKLREEDDAISTKEAGGGDEFMLVFFLPMVGEKEKLSLDDTNVNCRHTLRPV